MDKKILMIAASLVFFMGLFSLPVNVLASVAETIGAATGKIDSLLPGDMVKSDNISELVGNAISLLLGIIGSISLIIFLYSGIMWMTAAGNAKKVEDAEKAMIWAALGLFAIFISYVLVKYIIGGMSF